ncbi:hypothetical protein POTOM_029177 [Populus tomentosa]|uniref:LysM domain-containing protein n=1 Tax=Populus tomentosa TaxID=118781 RepID=A0A8X8CSP4_POPTO|nr:hypothetical protein POTOM_029177 [Populus tomentosa]
MATSVSTFNGMPTTLSKFYPDFERFTNSDEGVENKNILSSRLKVPEGRNGREKISWYCALLMALMLVLSCCEVSESELAAAGHPRVFEEKPCDEIYVVGEGETLHTISEKCRDPYIVEENPHIHDPDDVFPGLVIKISPFNDR